MIGIAGQGAGRWARRAVWLGWMLAMTGWLACGCGRRGEESAGAQLRLTTPELGPATGLEVLWERPVVGLADVGMTSAVLPLVIEPSVKGEFVWRSRRSGLFRPLEAWPLGRVVEVRQREGLRDAEGRLVTARMRRRVEVPGLEWALEPVEGWEPGLMPSLPVVLLKANAALDAGSVQGRAHFTDGTRRVSARVEVGGTNDAGWHRTWRDRFLGQAGAGGEVDEAGWGGVGEVREAGAVLRLTPASPLVSTGAWRLVVGPAVRATSGVAARRGGELMLGQSLPFGVSEVVASSTLARGREVEVRFTRRVSPDAITNVAAWLSVEPPVAGWTARMPGGGAGERVWVRGGFGLGTNYVLRVRGGLASLDGAEMSGEAVWTNAFSPLRPNAWLPAFDAVQLAEGARGLGVLTVNVPEVRVRAKRLDVAGLIPALRAYERYRRLATPWEPDMVGGAALDYAALAGRTVRDETVVLGSASADEPVKTELGWDRLAGRGEPGAYFVEVDLHGLAGEGGGGTRVGPQALVQLTGLGHVLKRGGGEAVAWVFRHRDARPVEGARVSLRTDEDEELAWGRTDALGLARMASPTNAAWVRVELGSDVHAARVDEGELGLWNYGLPGREPSVSGVRLLGFVDRTLLRPGEVVHVKWVGRRWNGADWELPGTNRVLLEMKGARGDLLARTNAMLGDLGTGTWDWAVPAGVRGPVTLESTLGDATWVQALEVREFQPPAFEVRADVSAGVGPGAPVRAGVLATSLQGRPLARGKVRWFLRATDASEVPGSWGGFTFVGPSRGAGGEGGLPDDVHEQGQGWTDAAGGMSWEATLPMNAREPRPQWLKLELDVTDVDQKTWEGSREALRHASDFYLGYRWRGGAEFVPEAGKPLPLEVVAMDRDGKPWGGAVRVRGRLLRTERSVVRVERAGRSLGHETRVRHEEVGTIEGVVKPAEAEGPGWRATSELALPSPPSPGEYWIELTAEDPGGRRVQTQGMFHVSGDTRLAWHWKAGQAIELVPLRAGWAKAGTRWPILAKAPFGGTALVTVEREGVRRALVREVTGNSPWLDVPLESGDGPNVHVGVLLVRGIEGNPHLHPMPEWRAGYLPVLMPARERRLTVEVQAARASLRPREEASVTVRVRDAGGGAVAGAEVTLYAVDEAVLLMGGNPPPDLAGDLEEPMALGVRTTVSLARLLPEDPALRTFSNKGHAGGGGGRQAWLRRNFEPAPYWNAGLRTDVGGEARAAFAVPDALTRYRLVAVAWHGLASSGTGVGGLVVQKPLMIEPSLPRVAHVGDRLMARAVVNNGLGHGVEARVTVRPGTNAAPAPGAGLVMTVSVPPGGSVPVDVEVACVSAGEDPWSWRVEGAGESDGVEVRMPVMDPLPEVRDGGWTRARAGRTSLMGGMDAAVLEVAREVTVRVGGGPWALVGEGVRHLLHYPYGCAEQTASTLVPWLALRGQAGLLPEGGRDAAAAISAGVDRLWRMQTASGGLGYWPGEMRPQRWASAYGAWVLALASRHGVAVDAVRLGRLHAWLGEQWRRDGPDPGPEALHERCLTALALAEAGRGDAGLNEALASGVDRLTREDRCLLALAWTATGGAPAEAARWLDLPQGRARRHGWFGGEAREAALELMAFERCGLPTSGPSGPVARLMARRSRGHWGTTQGNAWAVWALSALGADGARDGWVSGEVRVGERVVPVRLSRDMPVQVLTMPVTARELARGVEWVHGEGGEAWLEVGVAGRMQVAPDALMRMRAVDRGFSVRRTYQRLDLENRPGPMEGLGVGDRVLVTLEIDVPEAAAWVAIDDPVPSVLEPSVERWRGADGVAGAWDAWREDFVEVRGGRRWVFVDALGEGRHRVRYVARVRAAGVAVAGPVRVEAMYEPGRHGLSTPATVTVR